MKKNVLQNKYVDFPGVYFDKGGVHWLLRDGLGSVGMTVDDSGQVEQHVQYYPYGEPHREPQGQPYLYGGKERRRFGGLNDYDFHARFLNPAAALWHAPDPRASRYPWLSPYAFCASNPVRYSDPTGMDIFEFDGKGNFMRRIKDDLDYVRVRDNDGSYKDPEAMKKRTIESVTKVSSKGGNYTYIRVRGDDNGDMVQRFLADNTKMEYDRFECGQKGAKGLNFIATEHKVDENFAGVHIFNKQLRNRYTIRKHIHNHPSNYLWQSVPDMVLMKSIKGITQRPDIIFMIYTTKMRSDGKNYHEYDETTEIMTTDEYDKRYGEP
jgi:RHS repeat-associated protein